MSANTTNPGSLFGGTWEQIQGRFLLAAGGGYSAGTTGGEATHKLTVAEMPAHSHTYTRDGFVVGGSYGDKVGVYGGGSAAYSSTTGAAGSGSAHNNMPPYLAVYVWKRTA